MNTHRLRNGVIFLFFLVCIFLITKTVFATDQIKTVEFYVYGSSDAISGSINQNFSIYIGDNISGISSPVKSAYFVVSGVYSGGGSINLTLNSANSKTYNLPSVSSPTFFELLYKDTSSIINPTTAGSYNYTFGANLSGVTIYGFGVKLYLTYRFVPSSCPDGSNLNEKNKTIYNYVYGSSDAISGSINQNFSIYIGDNISGISNPVKSVYFTVSGFYTGGVGTLMLRLNSDPSTSKLFSFPVVTKPTFFEILYKDPIDTINPVTAGNYSYTLNIFPSGITIYGFGAKVTTTYRYKPPTCGGVTTGELVSAVFETTAISDGPAFNSIMWKGTLGSGKVRLKIATSDSSSGPWEFRGPDTGCSLLSSSDTDWYVANPETPLEIGCISYHNNKRYFKYKIQLCMASDCTSPGATSPTVEDVIVNWSP